jgi:hypothetical protein
MVTEIYIKSKATFMISSRDCVVDINLKKDENGRAVHIIHTKEYKSIPVPEDTVRMDFWRGSMI